MSLTTQFSMAFESPVFGLDSVKCYNELTCFFTICGNIVGHF